MKASIPGLRISLLAVLMVLCTALPAWEKTLDFRNQLSLLGNVKMHRLTQKNDRIELHEAQLDFAWKPELFAELFPNDDIRLSGDLIIDARNSTHYEYDELTDTISLKLYRAWLAASYKDTEVKLGIQHIRFGPAQILRPLQWFDTIDPNSLLQDTEGVQALTLTHYFPNPEVRFWLLPGTGLTKGNETIATKKGTLEFGGRLGLQSALGATGISYHQRVVSHYFEESTDIREYRLGLDQRVDTVIGVWLEAEADMLDNYVMVDVGPEPRLAPRYNASATLGADYTFGIGNGLYLMAESNYYWSRGEYQFGIPNDFDGYQSALMLRYPLGLLDSIRAYAAFDLSQDTSVGVISWRRTYDLLSWDVSVSLCPIAPDYGFWGLMFAVNYNL
jgi:hypothetical protein